MKVVKKDNTKEPFNVQKVVIAVNKSAFRALVKFTDEEIDFICRFVQDEARKMGKEEIEISEMHNIVEGALERVNPKVAKSYRDYRNYKQDFVQMLDEVYKKSQSIMYIGDKENSNTDSALVSTKRSLIFNQLNKELYKKFFLTTEELQACRDGYIYIHDMSARRDTMNCCLFDVQSVLQGGFEMGNLWYNEPKTLSLYSKEDEDQIYYTTDGTDPTSSSNLYTDSIALKEGQTIIKAVTVNKKGITSDIVSKTYTIAYEAPDPPQISPSSGSFTTDMDTNIYIIVPKGCRAYYAFDKKPTIADELYQEDQPVKMLKGTHTFYAILVDEHNKVSSPGSAIYKLTEAK